MLVLLCINLYNNVLYFIFSLKWLKSIRVNGYLLLNFEKVYIVSK